MERKFQPDFQDRLTQSNRAKYANLLNAIASEKSSPTTHLYLTEKRHQKTHRPGVSVRMFGVALTLSSIGAVSTDFNDQRFNVEAQSTKPAPLGDCPFELQYQENGSNRRALVTFPTEVTLVKVVNEGGQNKLQTVGRTRAITFETDAKGKGVESQTRDQVVRIITNSNSNTPNSPEYRGINVKSLENGYSTDAAPVVCKKGAVLGQIVHDVGVPAKENQFPQGAIRLTPTPVSSDKPSDAELALRQALNRIAEERGQSSRKTEATLTPRTNVLTPVQTSPSQSESRDPRGYETPVIGGVRRFVDNYWLPLLIGGIAAMAVGERQRRIRGGIAPLWTVRGRRII